MEQSSLITSSAKNNKRKESKEGDFCEILGTLFRDGKELHQKIDAQNLYLEKLERDLRNAELSKAEMQAKIEQLTKEAIQRVNNEEAKKVDENNIISKLFVENMTFKNTIEKQREEIKNFGQLFIENMDLKNNSEKQNEKVNELLSENLGLKNNIEKQNKKINEMLSEKSALKITVKKRDKEIKRISHLFTENRTLNRVIDDQKVDINNLTRQLKKNEFRSNKNAKTGRLRSADSDFKRSKGVQCEIDNLKSQLIIANKTPEKNRKNEFHSTAASAQMQELKEKFNAEKMLLQTELTNKIHSLENKLAEVNPKFKNILFFRT